MGKLAKKWVKWLGALTSVRSLFLILKFLGSMTEGWALKKFPELAQVYSGWFWWWQSEMNTLKMLPEGSSCYFCCFFTKRYISFVYFCSRQKHSCGIMTYRLMPRMLPRPNMNFYLAWKKRSLQEWVSAIYYYFVLKKKNLLKPLGKVLQKLLL